MKKEKQVKSYQRRTKSGKMVTVRAHTATYDAADKAKEAAKKKGAGKELEERMTKKPTQLEIPFDKEEEKKVLDEVKETAKKESTKKPAEKKTTKKVRPVGSGTNGPAPKKKSDMRVAKTETAKPASSEPAFTAAEFKEWYRGTGSAADKKVEKALKKQLGRAGYRKLEDEAIDNYSSRGHLSMFKRVSGSGISNSGKGEGSKEHPVTKPSKSSVKTPTRTASVKESKAVSKPTTKKFNAEKAMDEIFGSKDMYSAAKKYLGKDTVDRIYKSVELSRPSSSKERKDRLLSQIEENIGELAWQNSQASTKSSTGTKKTSRSQSSATTSKDGGTLAKQFGSLLDGLTGDTPRTYQKPAKFVNKKDGTIVASVAMASKDGTTLDKNLKKNGWKRVDKFDVAGGGQNYVSKDGKYHAFYTDSLNLNNKLVIRRIKDGESPSKLGHGRE